MSRRVRIVREDPNVLHGEQIIAILWFVGRVLGGLWLAAEVTMVKWNIENAILGWGLFFAIFIAFWIVTGKIGRGFLKLIGWESD